jgi:hypothetical protein
MKKGHSRKHKAGAALKRLLVKAANAEKLAQTAREHLHAVKLDHKQARKAFKQAKKAAKHARKQAKAAGLSLKPKKIAKILKRKVGTPGSSRKPAGRRSSGKGGANKRRPTPAQPQTQATNTGASGVVKTGA